MKRILFSIAAFTLTATIGFGQSDAISKYFDKYVDDERFSMVYVSPKLFEMVAKVDLESEEIDPEVMEIIQELKALRVLSYDGPEAMNFYNEAQGKIDMNLYESLIEARDEEENVRIMAVTNGDFVQELLVLVGGDDEFALISFVGNIDLKKVGKLGSIMNINGAEHLEKLDRQ